MYTYIFAELSLSNPIYKTQKGNKTGNGLKTVNKFELSDFCNLCRI